MGAVTPQEFVLRWRRVVESGGSEKANAQSHFIELCALLEVDPPTGSDDYTFERGLEKSSGGHGWADVWKRGRFGWEYKGPGRDLGKAYEQLLKYKDALENPPLLVVSDLNRIIVHTNFTNTVKRVFEVDLDSLLDPEQRALLCNVFLKPEALRPTERPDAVTREAAATFARIADMLREQGVEPQRAAHFLIRLLFCLFAEDSGLLPNKLFTRLVDAGRSRPALFNQQLRSLFTAMQNGTFFGADDIRHINGGLFDSDDVVELNSDALYALHEVTSLDWSQIEPAILGTLFERSLDPSKRSQLGAHYTSRDDILLIVEPVLMEPLRRRWDEVRSQATELAARRDDTADAGAKTRRTNELRDILLGYMAEISAVRVLDPACGSGNFLYVSLRQLLDLWKQVWTFFGEVQLTPPMAIDELAPSPLQLHGIEINEYAHELAQVTVWIGYIQWLQQNGFGWPTEPILKPIETIELRDAILAYDEDATPTRATWPESDVIVGNPPFLGRSLLRTQLGDQYLDDLFKAYADLMPKSSDLCCYWFEIARTQLRGVGPRVGLLATQAIRAGKSRLVLDHIKETGDFFFAESDRPWLLDGASVRVSMVGFDGGTESRRILDGALVATINPDLTSTVDVTKAVALIENAGICGRGTQKRGPFEVDSQTAAEFIRQPANPNGRPNSDVVVPWWNGRDITGRPRDMWIIDFGPDMSLEEASMYEGPFEYVRENVLPLRRSNNDARLRAEWWLHGVRQPAMRERLRHIDRYCATVRVAKHRVFVWIRHPVLPDDRLYVFARDDDYFIGVLQARPHEVWSLATSSRHGVGNDPTYNRTTCFETYPFPWPPGTEPTADPRVIAIADAARELVEKRNRWLDPEGATYAELKKRTLTNLYNARPTWLDLAHRKLDAAVLDAYGWPHDLTDEEILERLLALNLERATARA